MHVTIRPLEPEDAAACDAIVDSNIPTFFGDEAGLRAQRRAVRSEPGWVAEADGAVRGFLTVVDRTTVSSEITWMAVHADWRGRGLGTRLVDEAACALADRGRRLLSVLTLGPSFDEGDAPDGYFRTRRFYEHTGFLPVQELEDLWPGQPPALLLVRPL